MPVLGAAFSEVVMDLPRQIGMRVYLCASGLLTASVAVFDPQSPFSIAVSSPSGVLGAALLAALCLFGLADVVINDVMSAKWSLPCAAKWRNDGYLTLAAVNVAFMFAVASKGFEGWFMLRFLLDGLAAAYVGYKDVQLRYITPREKARQHAGRHP